MWRKKEVLSNIFQNSRISELNVLRWRKQEEGKLLRYNIQKELKTFAEKEKRQKNKEFHE